MRRTHLAVLVAGLALAGCVGVTDGRQQGLYSTYPGNARFVTPQVYRRSGDTYLYDQSWRSWQPNAYRQNRPYAQPRYNERYRRNDPRRNQWQGHDNRRDRD